MEEKYRKALKNYTTKVPVSRTVSEIQKILLQFGASGIGYEYGADSRISSIFFKIEDDSGIRGIKVPSLWEKCKEVLIQQKQYRDDDHAYRVAMRNVKDWLDAQLALLATDMVEFRQIFLPYMTNIKGETLYEHLEKTNYKLLNDAD